MSGLYDEYGVDGPFVRGMDVPIAREDLPARRCRWCGDPVEGESTYCSRECSLSDEGRL